jgi:hypothetical protein
MPRGIPNKPRDKKQEVKRKYTRSQGQTVVNGMVQEAPVPIVHIERGSGGDIRYSVRCPGVTAAGAREEAQRQFALLKEFVESQGAQK